MCRSCHSWDWNIKTTVLWDLQFSFLCLFIRSASTVKSRVCASCHPAPSFYFTSTLSSLPDGLSLWTMWQLQHCVELQTKGSDLRSLTANPLTLPSNPCLTTRPLKPGLLSVSVPCQWTMPLTLFPLQRCLNLMTNDGVCFSFHLTTLLRLLKRAVFLVSKKIQFQQLNKNLPLLNFYVLKWNFSLKNKSCERFDIWGKRERNQEAHTSLCRFLLSEFNL